MSALGAPSALAMLDQHRAADADLLAFARRNAAFKGLQLADCPQAAGEAAEHVFASYLEARELEPCPHLPRRAPQPIVWCAWMPWRVLCTSCAEIVADVMDDEWRAECDLCGEPNMLIRSLMVTSATRTGPVTLLAGICETCQEMP